MANKNKLIFAAFAVISFSVSAGFKPEGNEKEALVEAVKDGYQVQRNLAYNYQIGRGNPGDKDFIPKDETKSCAWRKILLIVNPSKTDASDTENERFSCRNLDFEQDELIWKIVYKYLPLIDEAKAKGEYMVVKDEPPVSKDDLQIIDVAP